MFNRGVGMNKDVVDDIIENPDVEDVDFSVEDFKGILSELNKKIDELDELKGLKEEFEAFKESHKVSDDSDDSDDSTPIDDVDMTSLVSDLKKEQAEHRRFIEEQKKITERNNRERAEALVDKYISKMVISPAQRENSINLCLSNEELFISQYDNAVPIVPQTKTVKRINRKNNNTEYAKNYFNSLYE